MKKFFILFFLIKFLFSADFTVEPKIFSPSESPKVKDSVTIGGNMEQTLPVYINIYLYGEPDNIKRTISWKDFDYNYGEIFNRAIWDGKDNNGNYLPDGIYELKFKTFVKKEWSRGNEYGDNRGMFNGPTDVAVGSDGKIYVLDGQRIQVFDSSCNYLFSIQNPEYNKPGHWEWANSIAVYGNRIYVMDCGYGQQNIKIFDTNGNFIKSFGKSGSGNGEFNFDWLNNIAVDNNGRIWVVDSGNSRVQVFNSEGNFLFKFGSVGTGNGQFDFTYVTGNIAIDSNGNVYVTDSGNQLGRIQIFNSNGVYQRTIKSAYEGGPYQLIGIDGPIGIVGSENRICVASYNKDKIVILNNDGTFYSQIGNIDQYGRAFPGRGKGEFQFICRVRGSGDRIYTVECYDNPRVQIFDKSGSFLNQIGMTKGEFLNPKGVAVDSDGNVYVCDQRNSKIEVYNKNGTFVKQIIIPYVGSELIYASYNFFASYPTHIAIDSDKKIYICGTSIEGGVGHHILFLDNSGNLICNVFPKDSNGKYFHPSGIAILNNLIYIPGNYNSWENEPSKIFVYDKNGNLQKTIGIAEATEYLKSTDIIYKDIAVYNGKLYLLTDDSNPYFEFGPGVIVYNPDGTKVKTLSNIKEGDYIKIDNTGKIYVSNFNGEPISVFDSEGNYLYTFGECDANLTGDYLEPQGIAFDNEGNIYFSDVYNNRLYKYNLNSDITLATLTCEIDNTKPNATITYPPHTPINLINNFQIKGTANDKNFQEYKVYRDSTLIFTGSNPVINNVLADIDISGLSKGQHKITLSVSDIAGNTNSDSVLFYIDNTPPSSNVNGLNRYTNSLSFNVSWTGYDLDSGISCYDIQYKDGENGIWTDWLTGTTETSATFTGIDGHTYYFRSRAKDNAGNWENYLDTPDTYTTIDITKPVVLNVTPKNNSYVGAKPTIKIEVYDINGIKSSSINIKIDGINSSFYFSNNIITINPTFTRGEHTVEVNFSDNAGNSIDPLILTYNALNFNGTVTTLSPDPNPTISEVMIGGKAVRYYKVLDKNGNPASGVSLLISWDNGTKSITTDSSDENGIVKCEIPSNELGNINQTKTCSITEAGGNAINPPLNFQIKILPRESESEFSFGSGISVEAAVGVGGKLGEKKGMSYKIINTNLQSQSDDKIEVERSFEIEAGVVAKASVGGGVKNSCYAGAEAGVYASLVLMNTNTYSFDNPYSDEQKILRSGLVIASLLETTHYPIISDMLNFVISGFNAIYPKYQKQQELSIGLRAGGNAEAGAGLGIGDDDNVFLGIGIGAGIEGEIEILGKLLFEYLYENNELNLEEIGAGVSLSGELDLFGGVEGNIVGGKIQAGIGGNLAGKYTLTLYADKNGNITKAELEVESKSDWGIKYPGKEGITKKVILTLTKEQIEAIVNYLSDFLYTKQYLEGQNPSGNIILGPTEIANRFVTFCQKLSDYLITSGIPLTYKIEEERGCEFTFDPSIQLALGAEIEVGFSLEFEKSVSYTKEEGIIGKGGIVLKEYPLYLYEKDSYIPSPGDLSFKTIFDDCVNGIITAMTNLGELVVEVAETIGDTVVSGLHWISSQVDEFIPFMGKNLKQPGGGINEVFSFTPEGKSISELSSKITSEKIIENGSSSLKIIPGNPKGLLTINYDDSVIPQTLEGKLIIYQWDNVNRKWRSLNSIVDVNNNKIKAEIEKLGTFCIGLPVPYGEIILKVEPKDIDLNRRSNINVNSEPILLITGDVVPDGTLITVQSLNKNTSEIENFGTIITQDEDPNTEGIQVKTKEGKISFVISPPSKEGSGLIIAKSIKGEAEGKSSFNVLRNIDSDNNGLPDYWEIEYFGTKGQSPNGDPDNDGLSNLEEYNNKTNPKKKDTDNDGMDDKWEIENKLNPNFDDSNFDPDLDGYKNIIEYQCRTNPNDKNSKPGEKGDINSDGEIDIIDVILCLRQAIGIDQKIILLADMNSDGEIDIVDVILILRKAIGLD